MAWFESLPAKWYVLAVGYTHLRRYGEANTYVYQPVAISGDNGMALIQTHLCTTSFQKADRLL